MVETIRWSKAAAQPWSKAAMPALANNLL
jgi:hypothetical protein